MHPYRTPASESEQHNIRYVYSYKNSMLLRTRESAKSRVIDIFIGCGNQTLCCHLPSLLEETTH